MYATLCTHVFIISLCDIQILNTTKLIKLASQTSQGRHQESNYSKSAAQSAKHQVPASWLGRPRASFTLATTAPLIGAPTAGWGGSSSPSKLALRFHSKLHCRLHSTCRYHDPSDSGSQLLIQKYASRPSSAKVHTELLHQCRQVHEIRVLCRGVVAWRTICISYRLKTLGSPNSRDLLGFGRKTQGILVRSWRKTWYKTRYVLHNHAQTTVEVCRNKSVLATPKYHLHRPLPDPRSPRSQVRVGEEDRRRLESD